MIMATAKDLAVGADIQHKGNKNQRGVVIGNDLKDGDQVVAVEWSDGSLAKVNVNDIQGCLSIEEEFKLLQDQVNDKIRAAAQLVREANELADTHGKNLQSVDDYDAIFDVGPLENAMEEAGWNTSSWYC